jgi:PKD repeat protein
MAADNLDLTLESNECLMCASGAFFTDSAFVFQSGLDTTAYVYNNTIDMTSFGSGIYLTASGAVADLQFIENKISNTEFIGINIGLLSVFDVLFESNYISFSQGAGILLSVATSGNVVMANNTLSRHDVYGAAITTGPEVIGVTLNNNVFIANNVAGLNLVNSDFASQGNEFIANQWGAQFAVCTGTMEDEQFLYNDFGAHVDAGSQLEVINSTMDSASLDFLVENDSHLTLLNTTHDDIFGIWIAGPLSTATVKWFLHILVETEQGAPVSGASVSVDDVLGTTLASGFTGADGMIRWLVVNESYQIGLTKTLYTPHNITASGAGFGTGYADPDMDMSKTVLVVLTDVQPPVAVANNDIVDEDITINLDSTGSSDNVGIVNWTWVVSDVGGDVTVYGEFAPYMFAQPGAFTVTLTVWDAAGLSDMDTATITVLDVTAPVADAGPDQQVNSTDVVDFDGTLSTDNVGIVNYTWTFTYDANPEEIWGITPSYTFVTPGVYTVTLNATDAAGNSGYDTVEITVVDNEDPIADAGPDQTNNDEGTTISFDGTASTDNVAIVSYEWEFDYEDNTITLDGSSPSFTFTQVGDYVVTLTVMDGEGNFDTDTMTVSIVDSTPPEVIATSPDGGATSVSIETEYVITFSEPMDTAATEGAIAVDGATINDFDWNSDDTQVTITLSELEHDKEYTILVTDDATDVAGNALNDETFTFRTQAPPPLFDLANDFYWLIIVIILVVIMVILALRKRKAPEAAPAVYEPVGYEEAPPPEQYPAEETFEAPPEEPMEPMPEEAPEDMPPEEPPEDPGKPPEEPEE